MNVIFMKGDPFAHIKGK